MGVSHVNQASRVPNQGSNKDGEPVLAWLTLTQGLYCIGMACSEYVRGVQRTFIFRI